MGSSICKKEQGWELQKVCCAESLSCDRLCNRVDRRTQGSLSFTLSQSFLKLMFRDGTHVPCSGITES